MTGMNVQGLNFKADPTPAAVPVSYNQYSSPSGIPYDKVQLNMEKKAQKKERNKERWYKTGICAQVALAVAFSVMAIGSVMQIKSLMGKGAATKLNFRDVTKEKTFEELTLGKEMKQVIEDLKTTIERADELKKKGADGGSGIMLYGEPGGGKNAYVYALTKYMNKIFPDSKLIMMDVLKFKGMFNGETENNIIGFVENVIKEAKANPNKKYIVFLDEFDSIARKDNGVNANMSSSFQNAFKTTLTNLTAEPNIQVIAATNKADKMTPLNTLLDDAILNRFPTKIFVPLPTKEQFKAAFVENYKKLPKEIVSPELTDINNKELDKLCEYISKEGHHASFRDYTYIVEKARIISEGKDRAKGSPITMNDLKEAVKKHAENENWEIGGKYTPNPHINEPKLSWLQRIKAKFSRS